MFAGHAANDAVGILILLLRILIALMLHQTMRKAVYNLLTKRAPSA